MATARKKVINANIIFYGPLQSGKSSNLQFIHRKLKKSQRGQIVPMHQEGYPHVAYEFLPIELGELNEYDTNLYIYTSPAHDDGLETRLNLLNEAAGVVFIADSSPDRLDDNIESLTNLKEELSYWGIDYDAFPVVFQYNKRDLETALPKDELESQINPEGKPSYDAVSSTGEGVRDTFARICKMAVKKVREKLVSEEIEGGGGAVLHEPPTERGARVPDELAVPPAASPPASDVTLDVAPPRRFDDEEESDGDDLEVDDADRSTPEEDSASVSRTAPVPQPATEKPSNEDDAPRPPALAASLGERVSLPAQEDFLKTELDFPSPEEPQDPMGAIEAFDDEEFLAESEEDAFDSSSGADDSDAEEGVHHFAEELPDLVGSIALSETPSIEAISIASLSPDEVQIKTYVADDDDEDEPIIRLGSRFDEEMELDEEMLLDEEPNLEDAGPEGADEAESGEEEAVELDADHVEGTEEPGSEPLAELAVVLEVPESLEVPGAEPTTPLLSSIARPSSPADLDDDEDVSIIATREELAAVGMSELGVRSRPGEAAELGAILPGMDIFGEVLVAPTVSDSGDAADAPFREGGSSADLGVGFHPGEEDSEQLIAPLEDDLVDGSALPDLAIAPLEDDSAAAVGAGAHPVFEAVVENSGTGAGVGQPEQTQAEAGPELVSWGEAVRLDARTLRLPVRVRLAGSEQEVELAVTLNVDQLVEGLAPPAPARKKSRGKQAVA